MCLWNILLSTNCKTLLNMNLFLRFVNWQVYKEKFSRWNSTKVLQPQVAGDRSWYMTDKTRYGNGGQASTVIVINLNTYHVAVWFCYAKCLLYSQRVLSICDKSQPIYKRYLIMSYFWKLTAISWKVWLMCVKIWPKRWCQFLIIFFMFNTRFCSISLNKWTWAT